MEEKKSFSTKDSFLMNEFCPNPVAIGNDVRVLGMYSSLWLSRKDAADKTKFSAL